MAWNNEPARTYEFKYFMIILQISPEKFTSKGGTWRVFFGKNGTLWSFYIKKNIIVSQGFLLEFGNIFIVSNLLFFEMKFDGFYYHDDEHDEQNLEIGNKIN